MSDAPLQQPQPQVMGWAQQKGRGPGAATGALQPSSLAWAHSTSASGLSCFPLQQLLNHHDLASENTPTGRSQSPVCVWGHLGLSLAVGSWWICPRTEPLWGLGVGLLMAADPPAVPHRQC